MESFLLLTQNWEGYSFGYRLQQEGYVVKAYVGEGGSVQGPKGNTIPVLGNPFAMIEQFDCVLCDTPSMGMLAEKCSDRGVKVIGGCSLSGKMLSLSFAESVFKVLYPERSLELTTGLIETGWFDGQCFALNCFTTTANQDRLMDGNIGPNVFTSGATVEVVDRNFFNEAVVDLLTKVKYKGPVNMNLLGINFSFDTRVMHPYFELVKNLGEFLLQGDSLRKDVACSLRVSSSIGKIDLDLSKEAMRHVHPTCLHYFTISGRGQTLNEARRRIYRAVGLLNLPKDLMFRWDIGKE